MVSSRNLSKVADRNKGRDMRGLIGALAGNLLFCCDKVTNDATLLMLCPQMLHREHAPSSRI